MPSRVIGSLRLVLLLSLSALAAAQAGEQQFLLQDYVGRQWTNELVTYPFSAPQGACDKDSLSLRGPAGHVPVQLSHLTCWPGGASVQSAQISFLVEGLAPLTSASYTLRYGPQPVRASARSDLRVTLGQGWADLDTAKFGIRLLLGARQFPAPVAAKDVPGPVVEMRLAGGAVFGGGRLFGDKRVTGYSATLAAAGPVFAQVDQRYAYEGGLVMTLSAVLVAGDAQAQWSMNVGGDSLADGWELLLSSGLPPLSRLVGVKRVEYENNPPRAPLDLTQVPPADATDVSTWTGAKPIPGVLTYLQAWPDWWYPYSQIEWTLKGGDGKNALHVASLNPGIWVDPAPLNTLRDWGPHIRKWIPLTREPNGDLAMRITLAAGQRRWLMGAAGLGVGRRLNVLKDYVLNWPGDQGTHPRVVMSRPDLEKLWAYPTSAARLWPAWQSLPPAHVSREMWKRGPTDPGVRGELRGWGLGWLGASNQAPGYSDCQALAAYLLTGYPVVAQDTYLVERLRHHLDLLGNFDKMRATQSVCSLYDALIDTDLVADHDRRVLRAQMAYLGYLLADPVTWSTERGYRSYNLNMTVAYVLSLGYVACTIPEHPMAKEWVKPALAMMDDMLNHLGPAGEFPESLPYAHGSVSHLVGFAVPAQRAGFRDFVNDPRMKKLLLYLAQHYSPRDPRPTGWEGLTNNRRMSPQGRGGAGGTAGVIGVMARATAQSDPACSRALEWAWQEMGLPWALGDWRFGGFEYVYLDPTLPAETPRWGSEVFPRAGAILRHGLGTDNEYFVDFTSGDFSHMIFPSETGGLASIFAKGRPLASSFWGYSAEKEELMVSRVCLARNLGTREERTAHFGYRGVPMTEQEAAGGLWVDYPSARFGERPGLGNLSGFSTLPRQDYAATDVHMEYPQAGGEDLPTNLPTWPTVTREGQPPVDWRRQLLFLKDDDPAGANYFLLRDTVKGNQPTMWQFWTISEKIGTPEEARDVAAFLADKPGNTSSPARALHGDRFTAVGQFEVDLEYFIATPRDTPRQTVRWGTTYTGGHYARFVEYKDMLHLQLPGEGCYYVALFPRRRTEPVPAFSTLGDGTIIKVSGDFGTDYGFLSALEATATGESASFQGTAGSVQDRKTGLVLSLGGPGAVGYKSYGLAADFPVSLRGGEKEVTVEFPEKVIEGDNTLEPMIPFPGGTVTVTAPGEWVLAKSLPGVKLTKGPVGWVLKVPSGLKAVTLVKRG